MMQQEGQDVAQTTRLYLYSGELCLLRGRASGLSILNGALCAKLAEHSGDGRWAKTRRRSSVHRVSRAIEREAQ
jgi:hypothetical protein